MSDFEREERYIVIKRKHLDEPSEAALRCVMAGLDVDTVECVVVESDWPNYEHVWETVEQVANGAWQAARAQGGEAVGEIVSIDDSNFISMDDDTLNELPIGAKLYTHPSASVPDFDYNHPQYCEIIEKITEATHDLLEAAGHDAEYLLDMDEAIEANIFKNIAMVATEIRSNTPRPEGDGWIRCSEIEPVIHQLEQYDVRADEHGGKHVCNSFAYQLRKIVGLERPTPPEQESE